MNGLYEASGVALWLRTGVYSCGVGKDTDPGDVALSALAKFSNDFFSKDVAMKAYIQRGTKKQKSQKARLIWPVTMISGCDSASEVEKEPHFDSSLNVAGCHFVLWAWYYAMFQALLKSDPRLGTDKFIFEYRFAKSCMKQNRKTSLS